MKRLSCLIFALFVCAYTTSAQFYFRAGMGYDLPQAGQSVYDTPIPYYDFQSAYNGTRTYSSNGAQTYNIKNNTSFSSGLSLPIGIGYMINDNIGIQLDATFGIVTHKYSFTDENFPLNVGGGSTIVYNITTTQHANTPIVLSPSLLLQTSYEKLNLYSRLGFALPLNTKFTEEQVFVNAPNTGTHTVDDFTWQVKNSFAVGFTAAAGVKYKINERVSIWGELSVLSLSVYTKEQDLSSWVQNGQSVSLQYFTNAQSIKFSKTAVLDTTYSQFPPYAVPFSNFGFHVGVIYNLSEKRRSHYSNHNSEGDNKKPFRRR